MERFYFYDTQLFRERGSGPVDRYFGGGEWRRATGELTLSEEEFNHLRLISSTVAAWLIAWGGWRGNTVSLEEYVAELYANGLKPGEAEPPPGFSMSS